MQTRSDQYDLIIVGGGLVGASLACALADTPLRIAVVELQSFNESDHASYDDRSIALSYGSRLLFESLNLWHSIAPHAEAISQIHITQKNSFGSTRLSADREHVPALGYVIENRLLGKVLQQGISKAVNITLICPAELESVTQTRGEASSCNQVSVGIKTAQAKKELQGRLLIAADGGRSRVRDLLDIKVSRKSYQQTAIICNLTPQFPHQGVAFERFTETGPLAFLPLPDYRSTLPQADPFIGSQKNLPRCSVVWTVENDQVDEIMALEDEPFLHALQSSFGYRLGKLRHTGKRSAYPLFLIRARQSVVDSCVLIGNAMHTLHPVAGQGFNLGMRDVAALASFLFAAIETGQDIADPALLAEYEKDRARDYQRMIAFTDNLVSWFSLQFKPARCLRSSGLVMTDRIPWLKSMIARRAMGLGQARPGRRQL